MVSCGCNKPARHLVTKKHNRNHGRWFYNCPSSKCGFFLWDDETPRQPQLGPSDTKNARQGASASEPYPTTTAGGAGTRGRRSAGISSSEPTVVQFSVTSVTQITMEILGHNQQVSNLASTFATLENKAWVIPATKQAYRYAIQFLGSEPSLDTSFTISPLPDWVADNLLSNDGDGATTTATHSDKCIQGEQQHDDKGKIKRAVKIEEEQQKNEKFNDDDDYDSPSECLHRLQDSQIWKNLREFQREGVTEAITRKGRILLGDEMGLGKTIQAIAIAHAYTDNWPVLVVCPASLRSMWMNELMHWTDLEEHEIGVITKGAQMIFLPKPSYYTDDEHLDKRRKTFDLTHSDVKFWVTSYDLVTRNIEHIVKAKFDFVICDESHYLKNMTAKRTKLLLPVLKKGKRALLLTGTPMLSRPFELFTQISAIRPDVFSSEEEYGERYCSPKMTPWGRKYLGAQKLDELHLLLRKTVLVRRLKDDVNEQLPTKSRQIVVMNVESPDMKATKKNLDETQEKLFRKKSGKLDQKIQDELNADYRNTMFHWYPDTAIEKIPVIQEYLKRTIATTDRKMIIFAYHHSMLNAIEACVSEQNIKYIRIDGTIKPATRQMLCDDFQSAKSDIQVVILSLAISFGLTLSAADMVLFAELYWNPSHLLQAEDRAHRIGRVRPVHIVYLLSMDTIDGYIWPLVKEKLKIVEAAIDGSSTRLTIDEQSSSIPEWFERDKFFADLARKEEKKHSEKA